jgi:hypothetical protein
MNRFVMLLKAYQIVYEIRRTFTLNPQMVRLLLFVADTILNNINQVRERERIHTHTHTHTYIHMHTHKQTNKNKQTNLTDYSTQSKFFMVLRTV